MGLGVHGTRFLLYAKSQGVCFTNTAMIGRQGLQIEAKRLKKNLKDFEYLASDDEISRLLAETQGYAEPVLELLGATEICSFDASGYEQSSHIHDFNLPIGEEFKRRFDVVLDGGTLEHIFNFPVAIKNCMEMIKVGGHFIGISPANNFFGHGFYQFSPELFFTLFNKERGFEVEQMLFYEDLPNADWYEVVSPEVVRERVILTNSVPTNLLIRARRIEDVPVFASTPQQSDYVLTWNPQEGTQASLQAARESMSRSRIKGLIPLRVKAFYHHFRNRMMKTYHRHVTYYEPKYFKVFRDET